MASLIELRNKAVARQAKASGGAFPTLPVAHTPPVNQPEREYANPEGLTLEKPIAAMPQVTAGGAVGRESITLLPTNPRRAYLYIQNNSTAPMYVAYDTNANPLTSIVIGAGGYYEPRVAPTNAIYLASASLNHAAYAYAEGSR